MSEIGKMDLTSENVVDDRLAKLKELMPEVFSESGIDFDKLRLELGDEVDEGQERYAFTWPGKADAIRQSQTVSTATLRPCVEKSRSRNGEDGSFDSDNIYIEGDNLEVLKLLQRGYHGKVKMIYIDPPYNTGHDFVYHDSFGDTIENYKEQAGLVNQSNADTSGRYHSDWCSMMYPRLRLARELLSDDGVLYISIGDSELFNMHTMTSEIFGESNFVACLTRRALHTVRNSSKDFNQNADYVLVFIKNRGYYDEHREDWFRQKTDKSANYPFNDNDGKGLYKLDPIYARNYARPYTYTFSNGVIWQAPDGSYPRYSVETLSTMEKNGEIVFSKNGNPSAKRYLSRVQEGQPPDVVLKSEDVRFNSDGTKLLAETLGVDKAFSQPKPIELIQYLISLRNTEDSIVLDFFSGSASTAHAVIKMNAADGMNRRYIMVQLPEICAPDSTGAQAGMATLCDIGEERIRRAGDKIKTELEESNRQLKLDEEPKKLPDIGFRVFTLDNSGIEKPEPGKLVLDVVKPDRSDMDIVFEMMLKWGLELTLPVEQEEAADYPIYSVACGELVCCLAPGLTIEALEAIADIEPRRVLMRDSILTDSLKLNAAQIFKRVAEKTGREVELRTV